MIIVDGIVVNIMAVAGSTRSSLCGNKRGDEVPGNEGRKNDEVWAMYVVPIICIISISVVMSWIICCMMAAMLFVWCMRMSFIMTVHVMAHLKASVQVWVRRQYGRVRHR